MMWIQGESQGARLIQSTIEGELRAQLNCTELPTSAKNWFKDNLGRNLQALDTEKDSYDFLQRENLTSHIPGAKLSAARFEEIVNEVGTTLLGIRDGWLRQLDGILSPKVCVTSNTKVYVFS